MTFRIGCYEKTLQILFDFQGQGPSASGGQDDMSGGTSQINIEGIKCLCNLQASVSTDGTAGASASGGGNCGFDRPAPTVNRFQTCSCQKNFTF